MKLSSEIYWKLKAKIVESILLKERAEKLLEQSNIIKNNALEDLELDTNKNYNMNDEELEITEIQ